MGGTLGAKNFSWPQTIGASPTVSPLVSGGQSDSSSTSNQFPRPQVVKPPLIPQPISKMINPTALYGGVGKGYPK